MKTWKFFLWICWNHQEDKEPFRFFETAGKAREWIEAEHERLWDTKKNRFKSKAVRGNPIRESLGFELATLYRILPSGQPKYVDSYSTEAGRDGTAIGWDAKE